MKLILGDNPFFGVNHRSGGGQNLQWEGVRDVMRQGEASGYSSVMLSPHPALAQTLSAIGYTTLEVALVLPYPHEINRIVSEKGIQGVVAQINPLAFGGVVWAGLTGNMRHNIELIKAFIQMQVKEYKELPIKIGYLCLHNIVSDMMLGLGYPEYIRLFEECCAQLGYKSVILSQNPGFVIRNKLLSSSSVLCFSYNSRSYMMDIGHKEFAKLVNESDAPLPKLWAMQLFASGKNDFSNFNSEIDLSILNGIVYGTSRPERVSHFANLTKGI